MSLKQFREIWSIQTDVTGIRYVKICFKVQNLRSQISLMLKAILKLRFAIFTLQQQRVFWGFFVCFFGGGKTTHTSLNRCNGTG